MEKFSIKKANGSHQARDVSETILKIMVFKLF